MTLQDCFSCLTRTPDQKAYLPSIPDSLGSDFYFSFLIPNISLELFFIEFDLLPQLLEKTKIFRKYENENSWEAFRPWGPLVSPLLSSSQYRVGPFDLTFRHNCFGLHDIFQLRVAFLVHHQKINIEKPSK